MVGMIISVIGAIVAVVYMIQLIIEWFNKKDGMDKLLPMWVGIAIIWAGRLITMLEY